MGCSCARRELSTVEEDFLEPFELSLNLHKMSCKEIDRAIYRFSTQKFLSIFQFERACSNLSLSLKMHHDFFNFFLKDGRYSAKKLSTLGVLLGSGSMTEKSAILFDNYDDDQSNSLESLEIKEIIQDVLEISCFYIPQHVSFIHRSNEDLKKTLNKTKLALNCLSVDLFEEIIGVSESITKKKFIETIERSCQGFLETHTNRHRCCLMYNKNIKPYEEVFKKYENLVLSENKILHRFCTMASTHEAIRRSSIVRNNSPERTALKRMKTKG
jgi:hypothetical protein